MKQLRISLVAPSGAGKSTVAGFMRAAFERAGHSVAVLKLAAPLYELQASMYEACAAALRPGQQDQHLLEVIATEMRRIAPDSLVRHFGRRLAAVGSDVVLNDDLRDDRTDWPWLRENGFRVIRVRADEGLRSARLGARGDLTLVKDSPLNAQIARIREDHVVDNGGTLETLCSEVETLVATLLQRVSCTTGSH